MNGSKKLSVCLTAAIVCTLVSLLPGLLLAAFSSPSGGECPLVANGQVYVGSGDNNLYALDASSGKQIWAMPAGEQVDPFVAAADGTLYLSAPSGTVHAFDAGTGNNLWVSTVSSAISPPIIAQNGALYFSTTDGSLYALDAVSGNQLWVVSSLSVDLGMAVGEQTIYAVSSVGGLYAIDAASGNQLWNVPNQASFNSPPVIAETEVCIVSNDGNLYAFDPATGNQLWAAQLPTGPGSPPSIGDAVYIALSDGNLYSYDLKSGNLLWTVPIGFNSNMITATSGSAVLAASYDGQLAAFDPSTGTQSWNVSVGGSVDFAPVLASGAVYLYSLGQMLYAVDATAGSLLWTASAGTPPVITGPPGVITVDPICNPVPVDVLTVGSPNPGVMNPGITQTVSPSVAATLSSAPKNSSGQGSTVDAGITGPQQGPLSFGGTAGSNNNSTPDGAFSSYPSFLNPYAFSNLPQGNLSNGSNMDSSMQSPNSTDASSSSGATDADLPPSAGASGN